MKDEHTRITRWVLEWARREFLLSAALFAVFFVLSLWVFRPRQYYFFGDSWDVLYLLLTDPKTIFLPHNEHFMPLFKAIYYLEYKVFGGNHLPYMVVALGFHAGVTLLVYLLGRRLGLTGSLSVVAALIFSFSSVHWEVTGWSFQQNFELSTLLVLLAIYTFLEDPHRPAVLRWVIAYSLVAFWCGPIAVVTSPCLTVYYFLRVAAQRESVTRAQVLKTLGAIWLPLVIFLASVRAVARISLLLALNHAHPRLSSIPSMIDYTLYGAGQTLVLRCLTFLSAPSLGSINLLLILLALLVVVSYRSFRRQECVNFWFLVSLILSEFLAASVIRLQFGIDQAASSRYEYFPMVPLALVICLCWTGLTRTLADWAPRGWMNVFGLVLLAYYLAFHIEVLRNPSTNPGLARTMSGRQYVAVAKGATYPKAAAKDSLVLVPETDVPPFVSAPGPWPLWKVFQVLEQDTHRFVPIAAYLRDKDASLERSLIQDGGFEGGKPQAWWKVYGAGKFVQSSQAARHGENGVEVDLGPAAAFSQDALVTCPESLPQGFYTFSIQAKTAQGGALAARVIFKDGQNNILQTSASSPDNGDNQWDHLVISGLTPPGTCIIGADVTNVGSGAVRAMLDDAILVAHPATADKNGNLHFASPAGASGPPFWPKPVSVESWAPTTPTVDFYGFPGLFVHAPGKVVVEIPDHATSYSGFFGILPGAYTGDGKTAGVEFRIDAQLKSGKVLRLFDRLAQPLTQPADRGKLTFKIPVDSTRERELILTTSPAPQKPNNWDWSVWSDCRFSTAQSR